MACGLPKVAEELNGQIDAAKDAAKGLAEGALGGVADAALASIESVKGCLLYTSPSPRDVEESRMPSSA